MHPGQRSLSCKCSSQAVARRKHATHAREHHLPASHFARLEPVGHISSGLLSSVSWRHSTTRQLVVASRCAEICRQHGRDSKQTLTCASFWPIGRRRLVLCVQQGGDVLRTSGVTGSFRVGFGTFFVQPPSGLPGPRTELTTLLRGHPLEIEVCAENVHNGLRVPSNFSQSQRSQF